MKHLGIACVLVALLSTAACSSSGSKQSSSNNGSAGSLGTQGSSAAQGSTSGSSASQGSSGQSGAADVVVKEAGFADGSIYAYLENKGSKEIAITPGFVAYNASGAKLDENDTTTSSAFYLLPPGSTTFVATSVNDQSVTKVEAKPTVADSAEIPKHGPGTLEVTGVELSDTTAHISIKNTYQQDVSDAAIHLVCKDDAGKLAAIMPEDKFDAPKGGTAKVDTPVGDNNGKGYKGCEAYPYVVAKTTFSG